MVLEERQQDQPGLDHISIACPLDSQNKSLLLPFHFLRSMNYQGANQTDFEVRPLKKIETMKTCCHIVPLLTSCEKNSMLPIV